MTGATTNDISMTGATTSIGRSPRVTAVVGADIIA